MAINWRNLFKKYKGQWIALVEDEITVVGNGTTAKIAYQNATKNGKRNPILTKVPADLVTLVESEI